jgi:hypothetical protein
MIEYPTFPECSCEMHPLDSKDTHVPIDALHDPFKYLPPAVEFTPEMAVLADGYTAHDIDWRYYPAFQAAAFLKPKTAQQHSDRRQQFDALKESAESQGFSVPETLTELFTNDSYIDRVHHNCVWPTLPEKVVRLPCSPDFAVLLFLIEGQGCGIWHLLLAPDGTHTVINADGTFGCTRGYPPGHSPDLAKFRVFQCMDSVNRLLYHYFIESGRHGKHYLERLGEYFSNHSGTT